MHFPVTPIRGNKCIMLYGNSQLFPGYAGSYQEKLLVSGAVYYVVSLVFRYSDWLFS